MKLLTAFMATLLTSGTAFAAPETSAVQAETMTARNATHGYLGGMLGISAANSPIGSGAGFGLNAGYFFSDSGWGAGAFFRSANQSVNRSTFFFAAEGLYRFMSIDPGLHVGLILGSGNLTELGDVTGSSMAYGFKTAYDFMVTNNPPVALGADLSIIFAQPMQETVTFFSPMATARFYF